MTVQQIKLRRGTAAGWTSANPTLGEGELGFETDTGKFKIGNGDDAWTVLEYAAITPAASYGALAAHNDDTSNVHGISNTAELAYKDGPVFTGAVSLPSTTTIGTVGSAEIGYLDGVTSAIQTQLNAKASANDLSDHAADTTSVHGIANTALLETQSGAQTKADTAVSTANSYTDSEIAALTTSDIEEGTNLYFTNNRAKDAVGAAVTGALYYSPTGQFSISYNTGLTVSGGKLEVDQTVTTTNAGSQTLTNKTIDTANNSITVVAADISDVTASAAELNLLDGVTATTTELNYVDGVTSAIQTQLDAKAPLAGATFTGNVEAPNITITGNLTVQGTTTTVNTKDYTVRDNMIYMNQAGAFTVSNAVGDGTNVVYTTSTNHDYEAGDYIVVTGITPSALNIAGGDLKTIASVTSNTFTVAKTATDTYVSGGIARGKSAANPDLGFAAGYNDGSYAHAGLFRDASDGTWKLFDGYTPEPDESLYIDTTHASFALAPIAVESITATSATIGDVSNTELQYLNGVTSAIQTQLNSKAPLADPTFTGTVTVSSSGVAFTDATQTKAGVPSITTISQKTTSYTLSNLNERDTLIEVGSSSATTLTIPAESSVNYPVGTTLDILQTGTGQVTIAGAAGVTVNATPGLKLRTQWSSATLMKRAADTWIVFGDLSA